MLRITRTNCDDGSIILKLEGRLIDGWVDLLRQVWEEHQCQEGTNAPLKLDMSAVSFADMAGVDLLRDLQKKGVACISWSPFLKELVVNRTSLPNKEWI